MQEHSQYILDVNARFPELGGARVVPLFYNSTEDMLDEVLPKINGVLFTGGGLDLYDNKTGEFTTYTKTSQYIWNYAKDRNDNGEHFPLLGICQGFELFHILAANDYKVLGWSDSEDELLTLKFSKEGKSSRLFSIFNKFEIE
jgi:gamma-glutamyl hydrolase